jgi:macrolide phosphotransferase
MDFALHYATLGKRALEQLVSRYELAGGSVWNRMQEHVVETWAAYPSLLAEFAEMSGEEAPLQLAQSLLDAQASIL